MAYASPRRRPTSASVDIDVEIDEFETAQLIDALLARKVISAAEHAALLGRKEGEEGLRIYDVSRDIEEAAKRARWGDIAGALYHLTAAFPSLWPLQKLAS